MSPEDPRHGTTTGYRLGCRSDCCRRPVAQQRADQRKRYYLQRTDSFMVPTIGTVRRVQALAALGWSVAEVSRRAGYDRSHLGLMMRRGSIRKVTADRVAEIYDELSMSLPPETTRAEKIDASRSRRIASSRGWLPPLAWQSIDDPNERPDLTVRDTLPDPVVVDRILSGDWHLRATREERLEVIARWPGSDGELERRTGWNVARDRREMHREERVA